MIYWVVNALKQLDQYPIVYKPEAEEHHQDHDDVDMGDHIVETLHQVRQTSKNVGAATGIH